MSLHDLSGPNMAVGIKWVTNDHLLNISFGGINRKIEAC